MGTELKAPDPGHDRVMRFLQKLLFESFKISLFYKMFVKSSFDLMFDRMNELYETY